VIPTLGQPPVSRLTSISRVPPDLQPQDIPASPASQWRLKATLSPSPLDLHRPDIGGMSERDYSNKYYINHLNCAPCFCHQLFQCPTSPKHILTCFFIFASRTAITYAYAINSGQTEMLVQTIITGSFGANVE
jgi:hypothetical protein